MSIVTELRVGLNRKVRKPHRRSTIEHKNVSVFIEGARWYSKRCETLLRRNILLHYTGWSLSGFAFVKERRT